MFVNYFFVLFYWKLVFLCGCINGGENFVVWCCVVLCYSGDGGGGGSGGDVSCSVVVVFVAATVIVTALPLHSPPPFKAP